MPIGSVAAYLRSSFVAVVAVDRFFVPAQWALYPAD